MRVSLLEVVCSDLTSLPNGSQVFYGRSMNPERLINVSLGSRVHNLPLRSVDKRNLVLFS